MSIEFTTPSLGFSGYIGMRIVDKDGEERWTNIDPETGLGPKNLIVNDGRNMLGTYSATQASEYCRVGTGTTSPAVTQSDLITRFGDVSGSGGSNSDSNSGGAPWWHQVEREYQFTAGTVDGAALTEIGFFRTSAGASGTMFSRSLIKDGVGTPTSITLTATEVLYVSYTIRANVPNSDVTGTFQINSEDYNYTLRAAEADSSTAWNPTNAITRPTFHVLRNTQTLGTIDSTPSGSIYFDSGLDAYSSGSYELTGSMALSVSEGNLGGIGTICFGHSSNFPSFQVSIDKVSDGSKIDKDNTKTLTMNSAFKIAWSVV